MVCETVNLNPRIEKKPLAKKICGPIEERLLQGIKSMLECMVTFVPIVWKTHCVKIDKSIVEEQGENDGGSGNDTPARGNGKCEYVCVGDFVS